MVLARTLDRSIGVVSTIILARLLLPEDFGLIALAQIPLGLLGAMTKFGFDAAVIRKQTTDREYYDTAWTLQFMRGVFMAAITVALAIPASIYFNEPRLEAVLYVMALAVFVFGLENIGVVDFRKNLLFHKEFIYAASVRICAFAVTVVLAFIWRDYWALVISAVAAKTALVLLSYTMHPYRPRFSLRYWGEIMRFSKWLMFNSILRFAALRADAFFLGRLAGTQVLGLYAVAQEISNLPTSSLVRPVSRALLPGYAKIKDDRAALSDSFIEAFSIILLLGAPVALGIWLTADPLVRLFLGSAWIEAIPLIEILALFGLAFIFGSNCGPLCVALNKPHYNAIGLSVRLALMLPMLYFGTREYGAIGAAWAVTLAVPVERIIHVVIVLRMLKIQPQVFFRAWWRIVISSLVMIAAVRSVMATLPASETIGALILTLLAAVGTGAATYITIQLGLWRLAGSPKGAERHVLDLLADKLTKKLGKARRRGTAAD